MKFVTSKLRGTLLTSASLGVLAGGIMLALFNPPWRAQAQLSSASGQADRDTLLAFERFSEAVELIQQLYVEDVPTAELIDSAIDGMLSDLDPHSALLSVEAFDELRQGVSGSFYGLGIQIDMYQDVVRVVAPIDGTPAFRAGLKAGDLITFLDGVPVFGMSLDEAVSTMRGELGTEITLRVVRESSNETFDVTIKRGEIPDLSVSSRLEDENVGYIRISNFSARTGEELEDAVNKLILEGDAPLAGFVIDLRSNPGGALTGAVDVSDAFLDAGEIVTTRVRDGRVNDSFYATRGDISAGLPLVVLIDGGSASASEIVAAALQDHQRAIIMGQRSFGKGSVQQIYNMGDGGGIKLTVARYYSPAGTSIQGVGVSPDIEVLPATIEYLDADPLYREEDLANAIDGDRSNQTQAEQDAEQSVEETSPTDGLEDAPSLDEAQKPEFELQDEDGDGLSEQFLDYQLQRAVDLIQALALAQRISG